MIAVQKKEKPIILFDSATLWRGSRPDPGVPISNLFACILIPLGYGRVAYWASFLFISLVFEVFEMGAKVINIGELHKSQPAKWPIGQYLIRTIFCMSISPNKAKMHRIWGNKERQRHDIRNAKVAPKNSKTRYGGTHGICKIRHSSNTEICKIRHLTNREHIEQLITRY